MIRIIHYMRNRNRNNAEKAAIELLSDT